MLVNSRADSVHYQQREWPKRMEFVTGTHNVQRLPLIPAEKVLLPPLHIKLGLIKNFVKSLPKDGEGANTCPINSLELVMLNCKLVYLLDHRFVSLFQMPDLVKH